MRYLFYFFVLSYPFASINYSKAQIGSIELGFDDLLLLFMALLYGLNCIIHWRGDYKTSKGMTFVTIVLLIYLFNILTITLIDDRPLGLLFQNMGFAIVFIVTVLTIRTRNVFATTISLYKIATFILAISAIVSAYDFVQSDFFNFGTSSYRSFLSAKFSSTGLVQSRGGFGINLAFAYPFVLMAILGDGLKNTRTKWYLRKLYFIFNCCILVALIWATIISGSRSTWLMALVTTSTFMGFHFSRLINVRYLSIIVLLFIISVTIIMIPTTSNVLDLAYNISAKSVDSRLEANKVAIKILSISPLIGKDYSQIFDITDLHIVIHNYFLNIAAISGLLGLLPILYIYLKVGMMLKRTRKLGLQFQRGVWACLTAGFLGMIVSLSFYAGGDKQIYSYLGVIVAFYVLSLKQRRNLGKKQI